jgi:hypothetical protein
MADRPDTDTYRLTLSDWSTTGPSSKCADFDTSNVSVTTRAFGTSVFSNMAVSRLQFGWIFSR